MSQNRSRQLLFAAVAVAGFFFTAEILLRLAHFHYQRSLSYMEFGYPGKAELHQVFELDPQLLFRMKPGYDFKLGFGPLNSQGFRGGEFIQTRPANLLRIACLGDSVTFGTAEGAYPEMLQAMLEHKAPGKFQVYNFGVPGYSSWQGRKLLQRVLNDYHPDIVVIFFGWNDMWLARGFSDREQKVGRKLPFMNLRDFLARLRLYQMLNMLLSKMRLPFSSGAPDKLRVPLEEYAHNLEDMVRTCRESGATPIIATAPSGFGLAPLPDYFEYLGFSRPGADLPALRRTYNQAARDTASRLKAPLLDLDLIFQERGARNFFDRPDKDVIHPNRAGLELIAQAVMETVFTQIRDRGFKEVSK
jgi:lysophospholipase L1-like esterase